MISKLSDAVSHINWSKYKDLNMFTSAVETNMTQYIYDFLLAHVDVAIFEDVLEGNYPLDVEKN